MYWNGGGGSGCDLDPGCGFGNKAGLMSSFGGSWGAAAGGGWGAAGGWGGAAGGDWNAAGEGRFMSDPGGGWFMGDPGGGWCVGDPGGGCRCCDVPGGRRAKVWNRGGLIGRGGSRFGCGRGRR